MRDFAFGDRFTHYKIHMKIVIGLGNPGDEYKLTRHNAGYLAVDYLAEHFECEAWSLMKKTNCFVADCTFEGTKFLFAKPNSFMNESGQCVFALLKWYKMDPTDLIVIHDDTDLAVGGMKIQSNRGSAGHKGIASIISHVGSQDFERIRLGVRPDGDDTSSIDLVLKNFSPDDYKKLISTFSGVEDYVEGLVV